MLSNDDMIDQHLQAAITRRAHPEPLQVGVEQLLDMLRHNQRIKLEELPGTRK
jgi:hypothetical protein